jgi:hypothetical protein
LPVGDHGVPFEPRGAEGQRSSADQFAGARAWRKEGRKSPKNARASSGFTEDDWRALEAIKPEQSA